MRLGLRDLSELWTLETISRPCTLKPTAPLVANCMTVHEPSKEGLHISNILSSFLHIPRTQIPGTNAVMDTGRFPLHALHEYLLWVVKIPMRVGARETVYKLQYEQQYLTRCQAEGYNPNNMPYSKVNNPRHQALHPPAHKR